MGKLLRNIARVGSAVCVTTAGIAIGDLAFTGLTALIDGEKRRKAAREEVRRSYMRSYHAATLHSSMNSEEQLAMLCRERDVGYDLGYLTAKLGAPYYGHTDELRKLYGTAPTAEEDGDDASAYAADSPEKLHDEP